MKEHIKKSLIMLVVNQFGISKDDVERTQSLYMLGLLPRDIVKLVLLVENEYEFQFSKEELVSRRFDNINDIIQLIDQHMHK